MFQLVKRLFDILFNTFVLGMVIIVLLPVVVLVYIQTFFLELLTPSLNTYSIYKTATQIGQFFKEIKFIVLYHAGEALMLIRDRLELEIKNVLYLNKAQNAL
ncbi:hypothetical protein GCM10022386_12010 [Flavobacterium cheonhonense]|jgi:hypothetical protein|uniref:Uncharacterized protein n=1 Tax=Flavobacterium cheonhonense TaxID=706185 RepID=A0ABP7TQF7_9FLAO|nr:hypothetical protein [Flavobacterium cheonhonense]